MWTFNGNRIKKVADGCCARATIGLLVYAALSVAYATSPAIAECVILIAYIATQDPKSATAVIAAGQPCKLTLRVVFLMRVGMLSAILMMLCSIVETSFLGVG